MINVPILIVGNFLSGTTGTRSVCEDLADYLTSAGWSVFPTSNKPNRIMRLMDMLSTVWRMRSRYGVATIDTYSGLAFLWAEIIGSALQRLGKPYVLTLHGGNLPDFAKHHPRRVARLLKSAAKVTAPSQYLLEKMKPYRDDINLIPNPIDIQKYNFKIRRVPQPRLVWLRAFHGIYNASMAVDVAARLFPNHDALRLFMGGGDKGDGSLQKTIELAKRLQISSNVEFSGKVPKINVPDWLQRGDIFINTTNFDNTPVSVLEAMACGLCVVSTNVGGIPYLLQSEINALLVPPNDPDAMAAAINRLLSESDLSARVSENGRRLAEQSDWNYVYPLWKNLFKSILIQS